MTFIEYINIKGIVLLPDLPLIPTNHYQPASYLSFQDIMGEFIK